jgi:hypothetical protein
MDGQFRLELDNGEAGHCTIWGDPDEFVNLVASVWPI